MTAPTAMAFEMPDTIPLPGAAGILMPFHLGWLALHERGQLQSGETLLVHAGAGGAGSAAIQLGVHSGARVIATAGSPEKLAFCRDLGADVVINYRDEDFPAAVLAATDGRGVDVVFDAIGGTTTTDNFSLVGVCHAYVDDPITFKALTGFNFPSHRDGEQMHAELCGLIETGALRPVVGREVPFAELPEGLASMERRETMGRTVVRL